MVCWARAGLSCVAGYTGEYVVAEHDWSDTVWLRGRRMVDRRAERKVVSLDAVVSCPRFGMIRGKVVDLSESGMYVSAETSIVPIGAVVSVTFQPDCELCEGVLTVRGSVRHQSLQGFGIEFESLETHCREVLDDFLPGRPAVADYALPALRMR